jgi:uncharacterized protein (DUF1501 family)
MSQHHPLDRRQFLKAGAAAAAAVGLTPPGQAAAAVTATADACIFLNLVGGPSQLDTFDPKPAAPSDVRGPFRPIHTRVPGLHVSELFPKLAAMADRVAFVRSMHHTAAPIHETGFQLLQTGRLFRDGPEWPSVGAVASHLLGGDWNLIPDDPIQTGVSVSHGQGAAHLLPVLQPQTWRYEPSGSFADHCSLARHTIEYGSRFTTVNMFTTVFDAVSWDCHADRGSLATDLDDYRNTVAPMFDEAFTTLLTQLDRLGRLDRTLVVATGEFGRTPHMNANGGRDHWPGCWTALLAGGGVKGGRVVGASDATASEPKDRPVTPAELVATVYHALGIPADTTIPGPDGMPVPVVEAAPVRELF